MLDVAAVDVPAGSLEVCCTVESCAVVVSRDVVCVGVEELVIVV